MNYMADTDYLIDLVNGDAEAIEIAKEIDMTNERMGLSVISAEEYLRGIYYLYLGNEKVLRRKLQEAKSDLAAFEILQVTYTIAERAAETESLLMKKGKMLSLTDILIASTAITHNLILVTRNTKHFKRIPKLRIKEY